ncbi:MAG: hypothetical protein QOG57_2124 [Pseudonocardiales bacterium]|nr:hypothetical protein [Pseudonocardiales bacterium]
MTCSSAFRHVSEGGRLRAAREHHHGQQQDHYHRQQCKPSATHDQPGPEPPGAPRLSAPISGPRSLAEIPPGAALTWSTGTDKRRMRGIFRHSAQMHAPFAAERLSELSGGSRRTADSDWEVPSGVCRDLPTTSRRGGDQRDGQMPLAPDNEWNVGPDVTTTA